jgi:hypothetical protein
LYPEHGIGVIPTIALPVDPSLYPVQVRTLIGRESSFIPTAINQFGFLGLGQFGEEQLKQLGFYTGDEDLKDGFWRGSMTGLPGVHDPAEFLNDVNAQNEVLRRQFEWMDAQIERLGLDSYIGKKIDGVEVTHAGLRYGAHLDLGKLLKWLRTGVDESDKNGVPVSSYVRLGMGVPDDEPWPEGP